MFNNNIPNRVKNKYNARSNSTLRFIKKIRIETIIKPIDTSCVDDIIYVNDSHDIHDSHDGHDGHDGHDVTHNLKLLAHIASSYKYMNI